MCFAPQKGALFEISISKSGLLQNKVVRFKICFAPQRCSLTQAGCTLQAPKMVRTCGAFIILTCTRASRRNGVQFFISHLARLFRSFPIRQNHAQSFTIFLPFARLHRLSSDFFLFSPPDLRHFLSSLPLPVPLPEFFQGCVFGSLQGVAKVNFQISCVPVSRSFVMYIHIKIIPQTNFPHN